jgi:hypothetical protein
MLDLQLLVIRSFGLFRLIFHSETPNPQTFGKTRDQKSDHSKASAYSGKDNAEKCMHISLAGGNWTPVFKRSKAVRGSGYNIV